MKRLLTFRKGYFTLAVLLFMVEVLIALYLNDRIIRPYIGDYLVVILIYCFVKSFVNTPVLPTAIAVLLFAYCIETLQYVNIVSRLGLQRYAVARTVIGTSFEWTDIAAYTGGIISVLLVEMLISKKKIASLSAEPGA